MLLTFSIVIFIVQTTVCVIGCASKADGSGKSHPFKFSKSKSHTKFHVKGDTEVSKNGTVANTAIPLVSKVGEVSDDQKVKQQEVQKEKSAARSDEKKPEAENAKSQQTEKKDKIPLITIEPSGDLSFKMETESQIRLTIKNISDQKIIIFPVFGTLEMGESSDVVVTHTQSPCKEAKMVVVNSKYVGEIDLAKSFRNSKPTGGPITINLTAT